MNEIVSSYYDRLHDTKTSIAKFAIALGLSGSMLVACSGGEDNKDTTPTSAVTAEAVTPTPEQKCAIVGLEDLDFSDDACVIGPS